MRLMVWWEGKLKRMAEPKYLFSSRSYIFQPSLQSVFPITS